MPTSTIPAKIVYIEDKVEHTWGESDRLYRDADGYRVFGSWCEECGTNTDSELADFHAVGLVSYNRALAELRNKFNDKYKED